MAVCAKAAGVLRASGGRCRASGPLLRGQPSAAVSQLAPAGMENGGLTEERGHIGIFVRVGG